MANELTTKFSLQFSKNGDASTVPSISEVLDVTGAPRVDTTLTIGTTEEALGVGDVAAAGGVMFIQNLDNTNYVEIGLTGSYPFRIRAGGWAKIEASSLSLYAKADTAAVLIRYMLFSV